jgi:hypothetical protein
MAGNQPKYPIYIISKGRADTRLTVKTLEANGTPYTIVIEPQEYNDYAAVIDPANILVTPFSNLGLGSIPVRNFVWEHACSTGAERHWILDDNIQHMYRLHKNAKIKVTDGTCFTACEEFTDRYENVKMSGMNYSYFLPATTKRPPYYHNTRVYSCILLANDIYPEFAWRGRFNEDTDLSLRIMKAGYHTFLFNNFNCGKITTMTMKGGNTEELYNIDQTGDQGNRKGNDDFDNRREFAESLRRQHPDCVKVTWKWGRWHHHIDYSIFQKEKPTLKPDLNIPKVTDNKGLKLVRLKQEALNGK